MRKYILGSIHKQQIHLTKNNNAQLYFILGRAELHLKFSSLFKDVPDTHNKSEIACVKVN